MPREAAGLPGDDRAYAEGRGCYTTARWDGGQLRFGVRAARRLVRDAERLGIGRLDEAACRSAMQTLAEAAFGPEPGVVRLQASGDPRGAVHLVGVPRALGAERDAWRAVVAPFAHDGPAPWAGAKVTNHLRLAWAREHAREADADEALLFDAFGRLVEGARSNVFVATADGRLVTPPLHRGAVAGVAREILEERVPEIEERDVGREELGRAREIVVTNSVRGARPIAAVDGAPVAEVGGSLAKRLGAALDEEDGSPR